MGNITVAKYNENKAQATKKLSKVSLGKGKIARTIDKILIGAAAIFETVRELPGFEYLKTMSISNLTTKFNNWIAPILATKPNLEGLTAQEAFELGQLAQSEGVIASANSFGLAFSAILEFIVQHPTVTIMGVAALTGILAIPFKLLINKIRTNKEKKEQLAM